MTALIRLAQEDDAIAIQAIYSPVVRDTAISFERDPPSVDEIRRRITATLATLPWLVCERAGEVIGYAYAGRHRKRAAYDWSVDASVYIHPAWHRCGVGRALYTSLFAVLRLQHYYNVYAGATLPNPGSVGLHEAMAFRPVGVYRGVGFKHGAWHDVIWWYLDLQPKTSPPLPLRALQEVQSMPEWPGAIAAGQALLRE